jgi:hypothetical protein
MGRFVIFLWLLSGIFALGAQESDLEVLSPIRQGFQTLQANNLPRIAKVLAVNATDIAHQNGRWVVVSPDPDWPRASSTLANDGFGPYDAAQANNGSSNGVWVEGVKGPGLGEWLAVRTMQLGDILFIYPGHPGAAWAKNNRLRRASMLVFGYQITPVEPNSRSEPVRTRLEIFPKVFECTLDFPDSAGWRYIRLPPGLAESEYYVALVSIIDVWPGSQYDDTCIAEFGITVGQ